MRLDEFFDPTNIEHIKAYKVLCETGSWPNSFYVNELSSIEFSPVWRFELTNKMADAWVHMMLEKDKFNSILVTGIKGDSVECDSHFNSK